MKTRRFLFLLIAVGLALSLSACAGTPELAAPGVTLTVDSAGQPQQVSTGVQLLVLVTVLSLAPAVLILATSFTRIVIVLSLLRTAIGTPTAPPNQVIVGLSLLLTFFIMSPVFSQIDRDALQPYLNHQIDQPAAFKRAAEPVRQFMFKQTRGKDLELFLEIGGQPRPDTLDDIPTRVLLPAFVISELKTAFTMGFVIYVPFLIIEMVVSSVLLSMGMMMLPPSLVSLPFKILLFVMVDGWYLIARALLLSFR
ncbi:MAG: flagellar type III secretion system pore protein FliP [Chloroflexi bacterium]|nr:flagellar type III secretion system pore protein FliP [Chloroflexota bacterium]